MAIEHQYTWEVIDAATAIVSGEKYHLLEFKGVHKVLSDTRRAVYLHEDNDYRLSVLTRKTGQHIWSQTTTAHTNKMSPSEVRHICWFIVQMEILNKTEDK